MLAAVLNVLSSTLTAACGAAQERAGDRLDQYGFSCPSHHMFDFIMTLLMNLNENGVHYEAKGELEKKNRAPGVEEKRGAVGVRAA